VRVAITREVSEGLARCELTHVARIEIDLALARRQHEAYERRLAELGCRVERLPAADDMPDSVFVEDAAVVFDEIALIARPGAQARRGEVAAVAEALGTYRPLRRIEPPGTLDGGDVLVAGRRVFIGRSSRTNRDGIDQVRRFLAPHGYAVEAVGVAGCLHLKSAVTPLAADTLLANRTWIPMEPFGAFEIVDVDPAEPLGANALLLGDTIVYPAEFPRTRERIEARGFTVRTVPAGELAKAEGGVTCCSLIVGGS
jgi:dimethylargininase